MKNKEKIVDKNYCMSHFLAFRFIEDENINFFNNLTHAVCKKQPQSEMESIVTVDDIDRIIKEKIHKFYVPNKTAIFLSGGIDSAILAAYVPKGTPAYTFKCIADGAINETEQANKYAKKYELEHRIVEIRWEDFKELTPEILKADGVPFHSIEIQLYKAAQLAKKQGIENFIIGNGADYVFGGMDKLLSKDWSFADFVKRYNSVEPSAALKKSVSVLSIYNRYRTSKKDIDYMKFMQEVMVAESYTSYMHAFENAGVKYLDPYATMKMAYPLDLARIRNGEPKYMIRELFKRKYPEFEIPTKIPMPRAMNQWLKDYKVSRPEFIPNCTDSMTGDQKWLCWCLEQFLNTHEPLLKEDANV